MRFSASAATSYKELLAFTIDICGAKAMHGECYEGRAITHETIVSSLTSVLCHNTTSNSIAYHFAKLKAAGIYACTAFLPVVFLLFAQPTYALVTGPGAAWQFVRKITLSAATPLANFQAKITLTTSQYINMNAAGNDLRFYDINNNVCNYWIETWDNGGTSTIWVNVVTNGATGLYLYYGNAAAPATSNGASVFDFFDDFTSGFGTIWSTITSGGSVTQSGSIATLFNTNAGTVSLSNTNAFPTSSPSFILETKHKEGAYNRNRFYATTSVFAGNPFGFDNGYFNSNGGAQTTAQVFWNGFQPGTTVTAGVDYLSQWQITDGTGNAYNWNTYTYPAMTLVKSNSNPNTATPVRFISLSVTEVAATSTIIDWVRVRKASASFTEVTGTAGTQVANLSATITSQTNVFCNGQSTGVATVTAAGGFGGYTYSWNSSPIQTGSTATNLPVGTYTVTVNDNQGLTSGIPATIILQPAVTASASNPTNITCNAAADGTITISASGGTGPYSYSVDNVHDINSLIWLTPAPAANPYVYGGLLPGVAYRIRVKDNNGCISK